MGIVSNDFVEPFQKPPTSTSTAAAAAAAHQTTRIVECDNDMRKRRMSIINLTKKNFCQFLFFKFYNFCPISDTDKFRLDWANARGGFILFAFQTIAHFRSEQAEPVIKYFVNRSVVCACGSGEKKSERASTFFLF